MAKTSEETTNKILADHATGNFSARELGRKYGVGPTTAAKIVKGYVPIKPKIVELGVAYKTELREIADKRGELYAASVDSVVERILDKRISDLQFFRDAGVEVAATTINLFRDQPSISGAKIVSDVLKNLMPVTSAVNYHAAAPNIQVSNQQQQAQEVRKHSDFYDEA
jgi:hypothetical protein